MHTRYFQVGGVFEDIPVGGDPVIFTNTERTVPRWFE
jgi:hypothetical protein